MSDRVDIETVLTRIVTLRSEITQRLRELNTILGREVDSDLVEAEHVVSRNCSRGYASIAMRKQP